MKIHEVMTVTGLTKKAINYYAKQGLISPFVDVDNNYRDFNSEDVIRLKQISVLREFDMSVREIKDALLSREYFANALKASDADSFQFKFSLIMGMPAASGDSLPADMKAFTVPSHTYAKYLTKINLSLKSLVDDELPIINRIAQRYKLSKFPILECYHVSDMPFIEVFMPIDL